MSAIRNYTKKIRRWLNRRKEVLLADKIKLGNQRYEQTEWEKQLSLFQDKITIEEVRFAFEQAEKLLNDTIEDSQTIVSRVNIIMTLLAGALLFLGGYIVSQITGKNFDHLATVKFSVFLRFHPILIIAGIVTMGLVVILLRLSVHLFGLSYYTLGSQPKDLLVSGYYKQKLTDSERLISYYLGELKNYQYRITVNMWKNEIRWEQVNIIITQVSYLILLAYLLFCLELFYLSL